MDHPDRDTDEQELPEKLEVELLPYEAAKADRILRRLAELLVRVWMQQGEPDIGPDGPAHELGRVAP